MVTNADGSARNPEAFSNLVRRLVRSSGLPPIRLHGLRHSYVGVTLAVYAHVLPGDDEDAAARGDALLGDP